ncbi:MAG: CHAT domain-containing protein, partial [Bacteroidales bacterium]|nr:CHAT domain-containing protein [Bacteroidales bacterium]
MAWMYTQKGEYDKACSLLYSSLKIKIDSFGKNHPDIAKIYATFGLLFSKKGKLDSSIFYNKKALEIRESLYKDAHPVVAESMRNLGITYSKLGEYEKALSLYKKALVIWEKQYGKFHRNVALCYTSIGTLYANWGQFKLANEYYQKSLNIFLRQPDSYQFAIATCYANLGSNYLDCGELGKAMLYTQKAFVLYNDIYGSDNPKSAVVYDNLGAMYVEVLGDYHQALNYYKKSFELRLKTDPDNPELATDYINIGSVYKIKGDYELALSYYKASLDIYFRQDIEKHEAIALAYNHIGEVYLKLGNDTLALEYFEKVYKMRTGLFGENYIGLSETYLNLGKVHRKLGEFNKETECYEKGLEICMKIFDENNISTTSLYQNLAMNAAAKNDYSGAISLLNKVLNIQMETFSKKHPEIAFTFSRLGLVYSLSADYDLSQMYYLKALDANYVGSLNECFDYNYVLDQIQYLETLSELADLYFKKYKITNNIESLQEAISNYQQASDLLASIANVYYIEASKLDLLKKGTAIFEKALISSEILYKLNNSDITLEKAFNFSEQNKSSVLYEAIIKSNLNIENTSDSLWVEQKDLAGRIEYLKTKLLKKGNATGDGEDKNEIDVELSKAVVEYQQVTEKIRSEKSTEQLVLTHNQSMIGSIQKKLRPNELMLEYFVADSLVFCFVIGNQVLSLEKLGIKTDFTDRLFGYITGIKKHRFDEFQSESYCLYNELIKPIQKYFVDKTKLIIIPDGHLLYLPFGSLISQKQSPDKGLDFSKLDYLIRDYEIVYQYSANLWLENSKSKYLNSPTEGFLGIAPFAANNIAHEKPDCLNSAFLDRTLPESILRSVANNKNEYNPLPYSGIEIDVVSKLFDNQGIKTKKLIGAKANEQNFKNIANDFKYLHIATHGIINNLHPELSGLAFLKGENFVETETKKQKDWKLEQNTDGILYAKEIYDLDLNAELVVLSACESGVGKLEKGEGILSLTRGFLYKQVPNIVFSLWKINDKNTSQLMTVFYENILKGQSYSTALRNAKLNLINDKESAYPANWAAFSFIGQ